MLFWNKKHYRKPLPHISEFNTLYEWWNQVRNFYNIWPFFTRSTQGINEIINDINLMIDNIDNTEFHKRSIKLKNLAASIHTWYEHHIEKSSKREPQIKMLQDWLQTEISQVKEHILYDQHKTPGSELLKKPGTTSNNINLTHQISKYGNRPKSDVYLYEWWMRISQLSFYQFRSAETKKLDKMLKDFSDSVIMDRCAALRSLQDQLSDWKLQRTQSQRHAAVCLLESYITKELAQQEQLEKEDKLHSNLWVKFHCAILPLPFLDFDYSLIFDSLTFLTY